ncbi:MAG: AmmeMemoRadiSam system radical SAM enzyme [Lachnospiraceae bacterium]|nr:AmmeMemoRadiSam system radical SAM enzyme [Lachnospiraceae bacterium]
MARCEVCFRHCEIKEGGLGFCMARSVKEGRVYASNYGKITALALDPVEKKPLNRFHPGARILSVGSYGCNLRCPFCQNYDISWGTEVPEWKLRSKEYTPEAIVELAISMKARGNIGIAFTYNEPLIGYEFVRDTAKLSHEAGLLNVLVTNGTAELSILREIAPFIDAMNIDLKGFTEKYYDRTLGGSLKMTKNFIAEAVRFCHVELTTLIVPGENDTEEEMRAISSWISSLKDSEGREIGKSIPLHISRFFPRFHMDDKAPTDVSLIYHLADVAREKLDYVYTGNC